MLSPNRTPPPISPRRILPSSAVVGVVPDIETTSRCPTSWASVGPAWTSVPPGAGVAVGAGVADGPSDGVTTGASGVAVAAGTDVGSRVEVGLEAVGAGLDADGWTVADDGAGRDGDDDGAPSAAGRHPAT